MLFAHFFGDLRHELLELVRQHLFVLLFAVLVFAKAGGGRG